MQSVAINSYALSAGQAAAPEATPAADAPAGAEGEKKLSKNALKKLAKNKGKKKKEKPQWGDGSAKKKKEKAKPKEVFAYVNKTPKGHKKDLASEPMLAAYQPSAVEAAWQDWWEAKGFYSCDPKDAMDKDPKVDKFVMVIPPPNVTGSLHLGHALTAAVEDTLTRWHRMCGHATLYVPGELRRNNPLP
jgi:valyl-tRNA synthetase